MDKIKVCKQHVVVTCKSPEEADALAAVLGEMSDDIVDAVEVELEARTELADGPVPTVEQVAKAVMSLSKRDQMLIREGLRRMLKNPEQIIDTLHETLE